MPPPRRRRKGVQAPACTKTEDAPHLDSAVSGGPGLPPSSSVPPLVLALAGPRDRVVVNTSSNTVHALCATSDVYAHCGWSFQCKAHRVMTADQVPQSGLHSCGTCYGERAPFWKPPA